MRRRLILAALLMAAVHGPSSKAEPMNKATAVPYVNGIMPVMDQRIYVHALLDQFEARYSGSGGQFRYDGQAWFGSDYNKLWLKSEGTVGTNGSFGDGDHEVLYDRSISRYFDLQSGVRLDIDHGPTRAWGAIGLQGLALYFFDAEATFYFSDRGVAGRLTGSYDIFITNRLILQPQTELNFYSNSDGARGVGRGLSDIDAGLRLRYEWHRKIAPYVGITYSKMFHDNVGFRDNSDAVGSGTNFIFGIRSWF